MKGPGSDRWFFHLEMVRCRLVIVIGTIGISMSVGGNDWGEGKGKGQNPECTRLKEYTLLKGLDTYSEKRRLVLILIDPYAFGRESNTGKCIAPDYLSRNLPHRVGVPTIYIRKSVQGE